MGDLVKSDTTQQYIKSSLKGQSNFVTCRNSLTWSTIWDIICTETQTSWKCGWFGQIANWKKNCELFHQQDEYRYWWSPTEWLWKLEDKKKGSDLIKSGVYSTYSNYENVDDLFKSLTERAKILNHPKKKLNGFLTSKIQWFHQISCLCHNIKKFAIWSNHSKSQIVESSQI